jgi:hypothetical protein
MKHYKNHSAEQFGGVLALLREKEDVALEV